MTATPTSRAPADRLWPIAAALLVVLVAAGLRFGTGILDNPSVRDEPLMRVPIADILRDGWSVRTAIDFQEVKGPIFTWCYAAAGSVLGPEMNDLRLVSTLFFVAGVWPLLLIARRCGWRDHRLLTVAGFYTLVPYLASQGQLLMSEPSFVFLALMTVWCWFWGAGIGAERAHRTAGPILFAILLSALLHHRPHAVAVAGGIVLVATACDGRRSWPWWVAAFVAGLSRIPLWMRWGGLVTSDYQGIFGFGANPEAIVYLLAALAPTLAILIWPIATGTRPSARRLVLAIAVVAFIGALVVAPDLDARVPDPAPIDRPELQQDGYAGIVGTLFRQVTSPGITRRVGVAVCASIGAAGLASLGWLAFAGRDPRHHALRIQFAMLLTGVPLYAITRGPVYDRYLLVWLFMLPVVYVATLRRGPQILQGLLLIGILARFVVRYF